MILIHVEWPQKKLNVRFRFSDQSITIRLLNYMRYMNMMIIQSFFWNCKSKLLWCRYMKIGSLCRILSYFFSEMLPSFNVRYENEAAISGLKRHSYCIFLRSQLVPFFATLILESKVVSFLLVLLNSNAWKSRRQFISLLRFSLVSIICINLGSSIWT